jgi:hypothetical protein
VWICASTFKFHSLCSANVDSTASVITTVSPCCFQGIRCKILTGWEILLDGGVRKAVGWCFLTAIIRGTARFSSHVGYSLLVGFISTLARVWHNNIRSTRNSHSDQAVTYDQHLPLSWSSGGEKEVVEQVRSKKGVAP